MHEHPLLTIACSRVENQATLLSADLHKCKGLLFKKQTRPVLFCFVCIYKENTLTWRCSGTGTGTFACAKSKKQGKGKQKKKKKSHQPLKTRARHLCSAISTQQHRHEPCVCRWKAAYLAVQHDAVLDLVGHAASIVQVLQTADKSFRIVLPALEN